MVGRGEDEEKDYQLEEEREEKDNNIYFNFAVRSAAVKTIIRTFKRYQEMQKKKRSQILQKIIPEIVKNIITNSVTVSDDDKIRRNLSAIKIQKTVRGKIVYRSIYENRKNENTYEEFRLSEHAKYLNRKASIIQTAYREYLINKLRIGLVSCREGKRAESMIIVKRFMCYHIRRNKEREKEREKVRVKEERQRERERETRNRWRIEQLNRMQYISAVIIQSAYRGEKTKLLYIMYIMDFLLISFLFDLFSFNFVFYFY
jgi:IQ calmodulin-binding motif